MRKTLPSGSRDELRLPVTSFARDLRPSCHIRPQSGYGRYAISSGPGLRDRAQVIGIRARRRHLNTAGRITVCGEPDHCAAGLGRYGFDAEIQVRIVGAACRTFRGPLHNVLIGAWVAAVRRPPLVLLFAERRKFLAS